MSYQAALDHAWRELKRAQCEILSELRTYPTPISGCDAQYNHLIGQRSAISDALNALGSPRFVATPRTPNPGDGVESR